METVALARQAMGTRFEILAHGQNAVSLRAAAEEALNDIEKLDRRLSIYRADSEVTGINMRAAHEDVRVEPSLFHLLLRAQELSLETLGAFDLTVAPLVRCWGFMGAGGAMPGADEISEAKSCVGSHGLILDKDRCSIRFAKAGMMLDFGSIGKGWAIDRAVETLREAGVQSALVHGGTSTVYGLGVPPGQNSWRVAIEDSSAELSSEVQSAPVLTVVDLRDAALSVSAVWGKSFAADGQTYGHVIDPRSGRPVQNSLLAAVLLPSAMETDAISTALLTLGPPGHDHIQSLRPEMRTFLLARDVPDERCSFRIKGKL